MTPPILISAGLVALVIGSLVLRSFGAGYRIGRLLSATPQVSIPDALAIAAGGDARYVRVAGRIDSEGEFEGENHRPLVFRRVRLEAQQDGRWRMLDEQRQAVDFDVREGLHGIAVDHAALDVGLVVISRESAGSAGDVRELLRSELAPETPIRMRDDQVSSVEHASVAGVPATGADGTPRMTAGGGRPLILSTLDHDEAMRILAGGSRSRAFAAAATLAGGLAFVALGLGWALVEALA